MCFFHHAGGGYTGTLVSNDRSQDRRERLKTVLEEYLPGSLVNSGMCAVQGHDGTHFGEKEVEVYDRVLVDAPCGSERHVMKVGERGRKCVLSAMLKIEPKISKLIRRMQRTSIIQLSICAVKFGCHIKASTQASDLKRHLFRFAGRQKRYGFICLVIRWTFTPRMMRYLNHLHSP